MTTSNASMGKLLAGDLTALHIYDRYCLNGGIYSINCEYIWEDLQPQKISF